MASLTGTTIAETYDQLIKRQDSYSQPGSNIEIMEDDGTIRATGLYLEGAGGANVGIGVADADTKLEIFHAGTQLKLSYDATDFCTFAVDTNHDITITPSSTGQIKLKPTTDSVDFFQVLDADAGTPILNVDSTNERVGIGTAAPDENLEIEGSDHVKIHLDGTNSAVIRLDKGAADDQAFVVHETNDANNWFAGTPGSGDISGTPYMIGTAATTSKLIILTSGNVGIGTDDPGENLEIAADGATLEVNATGTNTDATIKLSDAGTTRWSIYNDAAGSGTVDTLIIADDDGAVRMSAGQDGKVGIGTATPGNQLTVSGSGDQTIEINSTSSGDPALKLVTSANRINNIDFHDDAVGGRFSYDHSNHSYHWTTGGGTSSGYEKMTIQNSGNVGIGTEAPAALLELDMGAVDTYAFKIVNSDVAHGMTDLVETDCFGAIQKSSELGGGLQIEGYTDTDAPASGAINIIGTVGEAVATAKTTSGWGAIRCIGAIKASATRGASTSDGNLMSVEDNGTVRFIFDAEGSGHADVEWVAFSDSRLKMNQEDCPYGLAEVLKLLPKRYDKHSGDIQDGNVILEEQSRKMIGFLAQDVKEIIPELVKDIDISESFYSMDDGKLMAVLVKAIQELSAKVDALENNNQQGESSNEQEEPDNGGDASSESSGEDSGGVEADSSDSSDSASGTSEASESSSDDGDQSSGSSGSDSSDDSKGGSGGDDSGGDEDESSGDGRSVEPSGDWIKDELKEYMDANDIEYNSGDTKQDLLDKISLAGEGPDDG